LMHALSSAYHNLMPPSCYPFALLFLDCDAEEVDVNVHPSKTEVRFRHGTFVHDFVRDTIRERLMQARPVSNLSPTWRPQPAADLPFSDFTQRIENQQFEPVPPAAVAGEPIEDLPIFTLRPSASPAPRFDFSGDPIPVAAPRLPVPDTHGPLPAGAAAEGMVQSLAALPDLRPLGQIH